MDELNEHKKHLNQIRQFYPSLKKQSDVWAWGMYNSICEQQMLKEFITKTIDEEKTKNELLNRFKDKITKIETSLGEGFIWVLFLKNQFDNINEINKFMDSFGWFPAYLEDKKYSKTNLDSKLNNSQLIIRYEAKYDREVSIKEKYLYHLAPDILFKRVELYGLTPKNKEKISSHPERVYLLNPSSKDEFEDIAITLWGNWGEETKNIIKYYHLLQIDVQKLIEERNIKFYNDPNFFMGNGAVWVYENIPPIYIQSKNKILVNPNGTGKITQKIK